MGGLGRWTCARARRHLPRALLDRAGARRTRGAGHARRAAGERAHRCRRMGAPKRAARGHLRPAAGAHSGNPHRRRHHHRLCRRLRRPRPLRLSGAGHGLHPARAGRAGDARGRPAARAGAGGTGSGRRLCHAAAGGVGGARLLVALYLSRGGDRRRLCARALPDVALARDHGGGGERAVDPAGRWARERRRARRPCIPRGCRFCAGGAPDRRGPVVRSRCSARADRRGLVGGTRRLSPGSRVPGAGEPARSGGAHHVRRAGRRDGRDRLADRCGRRRGAGGGGARRAGHRALGARLQS